MADPTDPTEAPDPAGAKAEAAAAKEVADATATTVANKKEGVAQSEEDLKIKRAILAAEKESTSNLKQRIDLTQKMLDNDKESYATLQRKNALREDEAEWEARVLSDMRKELIAYGQIKTALEGIEGKDKERFESASKNLKALDKQLNSVELAGTAMKLANSALEETTGLQDKLQKSAQVWGASFAQGTVGILLLKKAWIDMQKVTEKTLRTGWDLIIQYDAQTKAMERQLRLGPAYTERVKSNWKELNEFGVSLEEATKAEMALVKGVTDYTIMGAKAQETLSQHAAMAAELGVSLESTAQGIQNSMKMMGYSEDMEGAIRVQGELAATAQALGRDQEEFAAAYAKSGHALAKFGKQGVKAFKDLQHIAKITGLEMDKLLAITNKFDTFEGAAEQAGKLNAALGGNFVNAMDLMMTTDPAERFNMIRDSILDAGLSFDDMSYYQKNFYKDALGLADVGDLALMLSGNMEDLGGATNQTSEDLLAQKKRAKDLMNVQEAFRAILENNAEGLAKLAAYLQESLRWLLENAGAIKTLAKWITVVTVGIMSMITVMTVMAARAAVAAVAEGTLTFAIIAQTKAWIANAIAAAKAQGKLGLIVGVLAMMGTVLMMRSPSLLVAALFAMAAAVFLLGRMSETSAAQIQALAIPMMQLGAAVFLAAAGIALMAAAFSLLSVGEMAMMGVVLIAIGVGLYFLIPALVAAGGAAMGVAPGLLILAAVFLSIGAGIGMAAAGIGLMATGMALLFTSIDVPKVLALMGLFGVLAMTAPFLLLASVSVGYLAIALGAMALSLALMKTEKLEALAQFASAIGGLSIATDLINVFVESLGALAEITSLVAVREEIEGIIQTINKLDTRKTLTFTSNLEALADVERLNVASTMRAGVGTAATMATMSTIINKTEAARVAPGGGGGTTQRIMQPVEIKLDGDKMSKFVIEVVGKKVKEINLHNS